MKKIVLTLVLAMISGTVYADMNGEIGFGYQTSSVDSSYGECWSECYGDGEPSGFALEAKLDIDNIFIVVDYADTEDKEEQYAIGQITTTQKALSAGLGYAWVLNSDSKVTFAVLETDIEWEYQWYNSEASWGLYFAEDSGVSFVIGAESNVNEKLTMGASLSQGFAEGIEAYSKLALTERVSLKASYSSMGYELGDFSFVGSPGVLGTPSSSNGDADMEFDNQVFRVSALYQF